MFICGFINWPFLNYWDTLYTYVCIRVYLDLTKNYWIQDDKQDHFPEMNLPLKIFSQTYVVNSVFFFKLFFTNGTQYTKSTVKSIIIRVKLNEHFSFVPYIFWISYRIPKHLNFLIAVTWFASNSSIYLNKINKLSS